MPIRACPTCSVGRRVMAIGPDAAAADVRYQAGALQAFLRAAGGKLNHVKPHGAFFAVLRDSADLARPVAQAVRDLSDDVMVYWPAPAEGVPFCEELGQLGVRVVGEIYPDLSYAPDGRLVIQRSKAETDVEIAAQQTPLFIEEGVVEAVHGSRVPLTTGRACIHGDGPNAAIEGVSTTQPPAPVVCSTGPAWPRRRPTRRPWRRFSRRAVRPPR